MYFQHLNALFLNFTIFRAIIYLQPHLHHNSISFYRIKMKEKNVPIILFGWSFKSRDYTTIVPNFKTNFDLIALLLKQCYLITLLSNDIQWLTLILHELFFSAFIVPQVIIHKTRLTGAFWKLHWLQHRRQCSTLYYPRLSPYRHAYVFIQYFCFKL